jgi:hypothetical protein
MLNLISKLTDSKSRVYNLIVLGVLVLITASILFILGNMMFTDVHYSFNSI